MRRFSFLLAAAAVLLSACPRVRPIPAGPSARVAVLGPFSGPARGLGARVRRGVLLAAEGAGGAPVELRFYDTRGSAAGGRAALRAALDAGAVAAVGPVLRAEARAAAEAAQAAGLPLLLLSATEGVTGGSVLRCFLEVERQARAVARAAATRLRLRRVAVLAPRTPYGRTSAQAFTREAEAQGVAVALRLEYGRRERRFRAMARALGRARLDGLFIADGARGATLVAGALAAARVPLGRPAGRRQALRLLGTNEWHTPALLRDAGHALEGAVLAAGFEATASPEATAFAQAFAARHGEGPGYLEAYAHDALRLLRAALGEGPGDTATLLRLLGARQRQGATGPLSFGPDGELAEGPVLLEVRGQRFTPLRGATPRPQAADTTPR